MKDLNGNYIHIGDTVTFNHLVRPEKFIGLRAKVLKLGEVRLQVQVLYTVSALQSEIKKVRVEPQMVVIGDHRFLNPNLDQLEIWAQVRLMSIMSIQDNLNDMVDEKIITKDQAKRMLEFMELD